MTSAPRDNLRGGLWLIGDMCLNIWALSIVKALGLGYSPAQIVFLRAAVGLVLILPWVLRDRAAFRGIEHLGLHTLRVFLSAVTLTASFYAIARVPLATFTAINFTRPLVVMLLAAVILNERIGRTRWLAAGLALVGVLIALNPGATGWSAGIPALLLVVLTGSGAVIATRGLRAAPPIVLMCFYTAGLAICTAPLAAMDWTPVASRHLPWLLLVGVFAQAAQFCFLRAHFHGEAGYLSVLSYASLILSVGVGIAVFDEIPEPAFFAGAACVIAAAIWVTRDAKSRVNQPRSFRTDAQ